MSKIDTGGDAYPGIEITYDEYRTRIDYSQDGMTLLDCFAARATENDIQEHTEKTWTPRTEFGAGYHTSITTREGAKYKYAAAMVAEKRRLEAL
jgi:hypothetical protein